MKVSESDKLDIINRFEQLDRVVDIAKRYRLTRGRVYQILKAAGVDTSKRQIPVSCTVCGAVVPRTKGRIRNTKRPFCSIECYHALLKNSRGRLWRHGQRIARQAVAEVFDLQDGNVVHHVDGNNYNNNLKNLAVFACQGDHVRHHRGFDVPPIWSGLDAVKGV